MKKNRTAKFIVAVLTVIIILGTSLISYGASDGFKSCDKIMYTAEKLNFRSSPSVESGNVIGSFEKNEKVRVIGEKGEWAKIVYIKTGKNGYVKKEYLYNSPKSSSAVKTQESGASSAEKTDNASVKASGASEKTSGVTDGTKVEFSKDWKYASFSKINSGSAVLYKAGSGAKGITVCVNAGHGTKGGSKVKTQCHPDGSAKVTGGTTASGATEAVAVSSGTTFKDGTAEAAVTLKLALVLKEELLNRGYDVLMIRESEDVQLDNVARTVIANNKADCHIALHWDSTETDKGAFYCSVPDNASYRAMEPVASNWKKHNALGESLITGLKENGVKICKSPSMEMDLTQTSYSTVPSVDMELGDRASDHSEASLSKLSKGLADGVDKFFSK